MDVWCVCPKSNGLYLGNSFPEKPFPSDWRSKSMNLDTRVSRNESLWGYFRYQSVTVKAAGKKNAGNSSNSSSNSSSPNSGNGDHLKNNGDGLKGNNASSGNNKSGNTGAQKLPIKPLDWREFRALLYYQEQAENAQCGLNQDTTPPRAAATLPLKWAHPISSPENGCLLIATEKLDGVREFERTVVLLLKSGTRNPQEGPFGVVISRPLKKKMKHMNSSNVELSTTFSDCPLHFGGPLDASMFLLGTGENTKLPCFEEVIPGVYFGSRNSLDEASALVKKGTLRPQDFRFFVGYAGWQFDQLMAEIESDYWYVAACSPNLIFGACQNSSLKGLWEEILRLMGGQYSELSRKPKQDT